MGRARELLGKGVEHKSEKDSGGIKYSTGMTSVYTRNSCRGPAETNITLEVNMLEINFLLPHWLCIWGCLIMPLFIWHFVFYVYDFTNNLKKAILWRTR